MTRLYPTDDFSEYIQLKAGDPYICEKATHYMLVPVESDPKWEEIIYYRHKQTPKISYISKSKHSTRVRVDFKNDKNE
jgi:hypothetical protein